LCLADAACCCDSVNEIRFVHLLSWPVSIGLSNAREETRVVFLENQRPYLAPAAMECQL
jgi:hypothetical protein